MTSTAIDPRGAFDLSESTRFLEGFTPASRPDAAEKPGVLRMAFPVEGSWEHAGVLARQRSPGTVDIEAYAPGAVAAAATGQLRRILSLDIDGAGFAEIGRADPVVGGLQERYPGLRPVLFHSPYEAACWAIIGQRIRIVQAARIKHRIAERHGRMVRVGDRALASFPAPGELLALAQPLGLPMLKVQRLHSVAKAAEEGLLDAAALRAMEPADALAQLRRLPGIGPFSAQLILIRGAGHPDVFPSDEGRLHEEMRRAYQLDDAEPAELERIAERWRPFRSWVALLLRSDRERRTEAH